MNEIAVVFNTFEDAMNAHKTLFATLMQDGVVSYNSFIGIVSMNNDAYISVKAPSDDLLMGDFDTRYGWTYLCGTTVEEYGSNQWIITMPEITKLENVKRRR